MTSVCQDQDNIRPINKTKYRTLNKLKRVLMGTKGNLDHRDLVKDKVTYP